MGGRIGTVAVLSWIWGVSPSIEGSVVALFVARGGTSIKGSIMMEDCGIDEIKQGIERERERERDTHGRR
jgi:hypothetical protein